MSTHTFFSFVRPKSGCYCTRNKVGRTERKKHVLTLTLMLVRRKSACKTSAGSSQILRWLTPLLGPNLDPKTGPKQRPKRRNENVIQFWAPFWGPYLDPKMGSAIRISLLPAHVVQADLRPCSLNMNVNSYLFLFVRPKSGCYCRGDHLCRDEYDNALDIPCKMEVFVLEVRCDASDLSVNDSYVQYDSVRSKDAVTLRPKYNSLNQYSLSNMKERCGDLVSRTCLAGAKSATSHSARNSMLTTRTDCRWWFDSPLVRE